jgi:hypothetical protein
MNNHKENDMEYSKANRLANNMRAFASFIEYNAADLPEDIKVDVATHLWSWDASDDTEIPATIGKAMRAALHDGADIKKDYSDNYFRCYLTWGIEEPKVTWKIVSSREDVCTKNVVGVHTVTRMVAPEGEWTQKEIEEEIVEWECHSLLAAPMDAA